VLAGALLGTGVTLLRASLMGFLWGKYGGKIIPQLHERHPDLFAKRSA
jgi:hypothetical protein